mmetsp:Transcript_17332/g.36713  ORF Transcript_17332/g.36713 Transcript_17332/m.36713 type:complete len:396 (+) Transcript_17332:165-1352(+)
MAKSDIVSPESISCIPEKRDGVDGKLASSCTSPSNALDDAIASKQSVVPCTSEPNAPCRASQATMCTESDAKEGVTASSPSLNRSPPAFSYFSPKAKRSTRVCSPASPRILRLLGGGGDTVSKEISLESDNRSAVGRGSNRLPLLRFNRQSSGSAVAFGTFLARRHSIDAVANCKTGSSTESTTTSPRQGESNLCSSSSLASSSCIAHSPLASPPTATTSPPTASAPNSPCSNSSTPNNSSPLVTSSPKKSASFFLNRVSLSPTWNKERPSMDRPLSIIRGSWVSPANVTAADASLRTKATPQKGVTTFLSPTDSSELSPRSRLGLKPAGMWHSRDLNFGAMRHEEGVNNFIARKKGFFVDMSGTAPSPAPRGMASESRAPPPPAPVRPKQISRG